MIEATPEQLNNISECSKAAAKGEIVEVLADDGKTWLIKKSLKSWNTCSTYRIKPQEKYRAWLTENEVPIGCIIRNKRSKTRALITEASTREESNILPRLMIRYGNVGIGNAACIFEQWTMDDGSPCGIKI